MPEEDYVTRWISASCRWATKASSRARSPSSFRSPSTPGGHGITPDAPEDKTERAQLHNVTKSVRLVSRAVVEGDLPEYESMELHARLYEHKISKNTIIALVYAHRLADPPGDHSAITCV